MMSCRQRFCSSHSGHRKSRIWAMPPVSAPSDAEEQPLDHDLAQHRVAERDRLARRPHDADVEGHPPERLAVGAGHHDRRVEQRGDPDAQDPHDPGRDQRGPAGVGVDRQAGGDERQEEDQRADADDQPVDEVGARRATTSPRARIARRRSSARGRRRVPPGRRRRAGEETCSRAGRTRAAGHRWYRRRGGRRRSCRRTRQVARSSADPNASARAGPRPVPRAPRAPGRPSPRRAPGCRGPPPRRRR